RGVHGRVPLALHDVQVGAADPGTTDLHDDIERPTDRRLRHVVDHRRCVKLVQSNALHCCSSSPSPEASYRCRSMPRQMLPFASMLIRVTRARRRCSGTACSLTPTPVTGSITNGASSLAGSPSVAR